MPTSRTISNTTTELRNISQDDCDLEAELGLVIDASLEEEDHAVNAEEDPQSEIVELANIESPTPPGPDKILEGTIVQEWRDKQALGARLLSERIAAMLPRCAISMVGFPKLSSRHSPPGVGLSSIYTVPF